MIFILAAIQFTSVMDFVIMMPLGPQFMRSFQIGPSEFGIMISAYAFAAAAAGIFAALFIDRFERKRALIFCYTGFAFGTLLCALAPTHLLFIGARVVAGAFAGVTGALVFAIIGEAVPVERRGAATGAVMSAFSVSSIVGVPFGLYLASKMSWHAPFLLIVGTCCFVLVGCFKVLPTLQGHLVSDRPRASLATLISLLEPRPHRLSATMSILINVAGFLLIPYMSAYMVGNVGLPESDLPYIYFVGGLFTFFTSQGLGRMCDRFGHWPVFSKIMPLSILALLIVTHLPPVGIVVMLVATTFFMITTSGRYVVGMTMINSRINPVQRGAFISISSSLQQIAMGFASLAGGWIAGSGPGGGLARYSWSGYVSASVALGALWAGRKLSQIPVR